MFTLHNLCLQQGGKPLLQNANLRVHQGYKVGLLGQNGSGKTSLLKVLSGQLEIDSGDLSFPSNIVISSAEQEFSNSHRKAIDFVMDGHTKLRSLESDLKEAEQQNDGLKIAQILAQLDAISAYSAPVTAAKLLTGLGFSEQSQQQQVGSFSGGWQMRLNLAKALMCPSDILLLDEPTNHLDLDAVFWLEDWIKQYKGTLVLVSHDVSFLDAVVTHIAHLTQQKLTLYRGNYSSFVIQHAAERELQQSLADKQQKKKQHLESFIRRFKAKATKAKQAQSRIKMLEKLETISIARVNSNIQFQFYNPQHQPSPMLYWKSVSAGYNSAILQDITFNLSPGERIGLIGRNGEGKSTFIKALAQQLPYFEGEYYQANKLCIGYFSQHQIDTLTLTESALWHLKKIAPQQKEQDLINFLGGYGYKGDRVNEPLSLFSGGEKARLALALLIWQKPNLLLLDEPTNHLDIDSRTALIEALQDFTGSIILVSHDRTLLESCCDEFYLVHNRNLSKFNGDLADYKVWLLAQNNMPKQKKINRVNDIRSKKQQQALQRQQLSPIANKIQKIETQLDYLQQKIKEIEHQLSENSIYESHNKLQLNNLLAEQHNHTVESKKLEDIWLDLNHELEALKNSFIYV